MFGYAVHSLLLVHRRILFGGEVPIIMRKVGGSSKPVVMTSVFDWIKSVVGRGGDFANSATVNVI